MPYFGKPLGLFFVVYVREIVFIEQDDERLIVMSVDIEPFVSFWGVADDEFHVRVSPLLGEFGPLRFGHLG